MDGSRRLPNDAISYKIGCFRMSWESLLFFLALVFYALRMPALFPTLFSHLCGHSNSSLTSLVPDKADIVDEEEKGANMPHSQGCILESAFIFFLKAFA